MIETMLSDRLWIYTAIVGAIIGAAFIHYFKTTKLGIWSYSKFENVIDYLRDKWGWTWLDQPRNAWKVTFPDIAKNIEELENRIKKLENK